MIACGLALALFTAQVPPPLVDAEPVSTQLAPPPLVDAAPVVPPPPLMNAEHVEEFSPPPLVNADVPLPSGPLAEEPERVPMLGVGADVGAPDGAGANIYVRLFKFLELHGGVAYNGVTAGLRGGVTFLPWDRWYVPTLTLEVGDHPAGDANPAVRFLTGNPHLNISQLENVGYGYQSALLGFEFGSREHYMIFLRGGVTRVVGHASSNATVIAAGGGSGANGTTTFGNIDAELTLPAAQFGFALYFF
ncbi:MAG: hypothetical protein ACJ790_20115 [Myxococcaceae bacterium]